MRTAPLLTLILTVALAGISLAGPVAESTDTLQVEGWLVLEKRGDQPAEAHVLRATPQHGGSGGPVLDAYAEGYAHCGLQVAPVDDACRSGPYDGYYPEASSIHHRLFVPICPSGCFVGTLTSVLGGDGDTRTFSCDIVWASVASDASRLAAPSEDAEGDPDGTGYQWSCQASGGIPAGVPFQHVCTADEHPEHGELAGIWDCGLYYTT